MPLALLRRIAARLLGRGSGVSKHASLHQVLRPFTMLSEERLESLLALSEEVMRRNVAGAFVECGTCRGGSAAYLAWQSMQDGWSRDVRLFDSFAGHPASTRNPAAPDRKTVEEWAGTMIASEDEVRMACRRVGAWNDEKVKIFPGWIEDTLAANCGSEVALAHLDMDWYEPTLCALDTLLPRLSSGAVVQVDDYASFEGCRQAVDEFVAKNATRATVRKVVDGAAVLEFH